MGTSMTATAKGVVTRRAVLGSMLGLGWIGTPALRNAMYVYGLHQLYSIHVCKVFGGCGPASLRYLQRPLTSDCSGTLSL